MTDEPLDQDDIDSLLEQADSLGSDSDLTSIPSFGTDSISQELTAPDTARPLRRDNIDLLLPVGMDVKIELGRTKLALEDILRLGEGSVVELDKLAGDPLDILVNNELIARGEVLILNENFCVRVTQVLPPEERRAAAIGKTISEDDAGDDEAGEEAGS